LHIYDELKIIGYKINVYNSNQLWVKTDYSYNTQLTVSHKHIYYFTQVEISTQLILKLAFFILLLIVAL